MELATDPRPSRSVRLRDLPAADAARVAWWRLGLTPTARIRRRQFDEGIRDGRGREQSLALARSYRA